MRPAVIADAAAVGQVLRASYPALMRDAYPADLLARALPPMTRPNPRLLGSGSYYLAEADGEPVGCGGWSAEAPGSTATEPGVAHIRHFATAAGWTGRGVGKRLYRRCEEDARAAGMTRFECFSSRNGEPFYAALGFERIEPLDVEMADGLRFPSVRMGRPI